MGVRRGELIGDTGQSDSEMYRELSQMASDGIQLSFLRVVQSPDKQGLSGPQQLEPLRTPEPDA